jgi:uncharacterized membrane protein
MSKLPIGAPIWMILGPFLLFTALSILLVIVLRRGQPPPEEGWKGIFYANRDDPALLVPKRSGLGYTLNFGNAWSWGVLASLIGVAALPFVWLAVTRHLRR